MGRIVGSPRPIEATEANAQKIARLIVRDYKRAYYGQPVPSEMRRFFYALLAGYSPETVDVSQQLRLYPQPGEPDGDKYEYRDHTERLHLEAEYRVIGGVYSLRAAWVLECTNVYHATVRGEDVVGTLQYVWDRQIAAKRENLRRIEAAET